MANFDQLIRKWNNKRLVAGRKFKLSLFKLFFDRLHLTKNSTPSLKEILVFRLDGKLGDSITSTGFLKTLSEQYSQHKITVVTSPDLNYFFSSFEFLNVLTIKKGFFNSLSFFINHRNKNFDIIINTSHIMSSRTVFLISSLKARQKISANCPQFKLFSHHALFNPSVDHITKRYQSILSLMKSTSLNVDYILPSCSFNKNIAEEAIKSLKGSPYVVLNSFAGSRKRSFSFETTVKIIKHLNKKYPQHQIISIGSKGDLRILSNWRKEYPNETWFSFNTCSDFLANIELLKKSDFIISPDTAIVHAASALNKKLIVIYRPDVTDEKNSLIWAPYGNPYKIIFSEVHNTSEDFDINFFDVEQI